MNDIFVVNDITVMRINMMFLAVLFYIVFECEAYYVLVCARAMCSLESDWISFLYSSASNLFTVTFEVQLARFSFK